MGLWDAYASTEDVLRQDADYNNAGYERDYIYDAFQAAGHRAS
jgi:hypothetical protein